MPSNEKVGRHLPYSEEIMQISLLKKDSFKIFLIIYLSFSRPLYTIDKFYFIMATLILLLLLLIYIDVATSKKKIDSLMDWAFYRIYTQWLQAFIIFLLILGIVSLFEDSKYSNSVLLIVIISWIISLIAIIYVCRNIYSIIKKIKELAQEKNLFNKWIIILTCLSIVFIFLAPDVAFSLGYSLFLTQYEIESLNNLESLYLSMIISNTLPIGETYTNYISIIGENPHIYTFQMLHVFINKIINWIIVGIIFNYFFFAINSKYN